MLKWRLTVKYHVNSPRRTTSYTCITTKDVRDTIRKIRGTNKNGSDVDHDVNRATPIDPWLIQTAFDKVHRVTPHSSHIASIKIEKGKSDMTAGGKQ